MDMNNKIAQTIVNELPKILNDCSPKNVFAEASWAKCIADKVNTKFKNDGIQAFSNNKNKEFSFNKILQCNERYFDYEHIPFHMKGTDIVIDDENFINDQLGKNSYTARENSLGIEFKIITDLKDDIRFNVFFFRTGCLSERRQWKEFEDYQTGYCICCNQPEFIQNNFMTHCKEGQFLSDYCRTIRILSNSQLDVSCFCGICIYRSHDIQSVIQTNMCELIKYFHGKKHEIKCAPDVLNYNSLLYIKYNNGCLTKRVMCTLQNFELAFQVNVNVLEPVAKQIQVKGRNVECFFYPYIVTLNKKKRLTIGCT